MAIVFCMRPISITVGKRILVLGDYRQTIVVVRSLARAGHRVILGTTNRHGPTALSRYVSEVWAYEHGSNERFNRQLERYLRVEKPDLVFVVGESQLRALAPEGALFDSLATWVAPAWATVERCFDKNAMYRLTRQLGIPTLDWSEFANVEDWRSQAQGMGYPVVVKYRDSSLLIRGRKALIFSTSGALDMFLDSLPGEVQSASLLLQKFAPGFRLNCHFGARAGKLVAYFEQKVLRTDELDGTGIGIEGISVAPSAVLRAYCAQLTEALGYNGIGCIQFLVDEASGTLAFLEFNPRMDSTAALPYRLHYDLPRLALELAGEFDGERAIAPALPLTEPYRIGVRYHWLYGDLLSWYGAWRQGQRTPVQLLAWALRSFFTALGSYHLTWDVRDPRPTAYMYWNKLFHAVVKNLSPRDRLKARVL